MANFSSISYRYSSSKSLTRDRFYKVQDYQHILLRRNPGSASIYTLERALQVLCVKYLDNPYGFLVGMWAFP